MMIFSLTFYQYIVHIDLDIPPNLMCKHLVYEPLIRCSCVLEAEWHHFVTEKALVDDE